LERLSPASAPESMAKAGEWAAQPSANSGASPGPLLFTGHHATSAGVGRYGMARQRNRSESHIEWR
jgi:hypothetical protein